MPAARTTAALLPSDAAARSALDTSESIAARLDEMERKLERLRALYESFFAGIERRPPVMPRTELNRLMAELQQAHIRNAALRFRAQTLMQRWVLLSTYWNRTLREIESGCYRRDLERAYRRLAARGAPMTAAEALQLGIPANRAASFVERQNRGPKTAPAVTEESPASRGSLAPEGVDHVSVDREDIDFDGVHAAYLRAHAESGRAGPPPTAERLRTRLSAELARLRAARPGVVIEIAVVARGGRVVLEARTRARHDR